MLGTQMDRTKLQALANELAKDIKTEADLNALSRELLKLTVETFKRTSPSSRSRI
jgi:hypothetical protein